MKCLIVLKSIGVDLAGNGRKVPQISSWEHHYQCYHKVSTCLVHVHTVLWQNAITAFSSESDLTLTYFTLGRRRYHYHAVTRLSTSCGWEGKGSRVFSNAKFS